MLGGVDCLRTRMAVARSRAIIALWQRTCRRPRGCWGAMARRYGRCGTRCSSPSIAAGPIGGPTKSRTAARGACPRRVVSHHKAHCSRAIRKTLWCGIARRLAGLQRARPFPRRHHGSVSGYVPHQGGCTPPICEGDDDVVCTVGSACSGSPALKGGDHELEVEPLILQVPALRLHVFELIAPEHFRLGA
jgi:hypothetical protein